MGQVRDVTLPLAAPGSLRLGYVLHVSSLDNIIVASFVAAGASPWPVYVGARRCGPVSRPEIAAVSTLLLPRPWWPGLVASSCADR